MDDFEEKKKNGVIPAAEISYFAVGSLTTPLATLGAPDAHQMGR